MASIWPNALDNFLTDRVNSTPMIDNHPEDHNDLADAVNKIEAYLGFTGVLPIYDVEKKYGAVPDAFFSDGVSNSTTTFTSASANFTTDDVGKVIVIIRGRGSEQDHHTTIASVTNSTTVLLTNATTRSQASDMRFYISRSGAQTTAIQNAINACAAAGGGLVYIPAGGWLVGSLVLKNRVWLEGAGLRSTYLHLAPNSNQPVIVNDTTANNTAEFVAVRKMFIDGNKARQTNFSSTLSGAFGVSDTTLSLASVTGLPFSGSLLITPSGGGTPFRVAYQSISGLTLTLDEAGIEDTTAVAAASGSAVSYAWDGIHFGTNPYTGIPTLAESHDPKWLVEHVLVRNCRGDGVGFWGMSSGVIKNVVSSYCDEIGLRPSFDTSISDCVVESSGRMGYLLRQPSQLLSNCKAFGCGSILVDAHFGYGFLLEGPTTPEEGGRVLSSCCAQDCMADGFMLRNAQRCAIQGTASSNGQNATGTQRAATFTVTIASPAVFSKTGHGLQVGDTVKFSTTGALPTGLTPGTVYYVIAAGLTADAFEVSATKGGGAVNTSGTQSGVHSLAGGTYVGVRFEGITSLNIVDVACTERYNAPNNAQQNGVYLDVNCVQNQVRITHGLAKTSTVGPALKIDSTLTGGNTVFVNGMGGTVKPAFSTAPIFDPYIATTHIMGLLTNNTTIGIPANAHVGCPLTIILQQDGSGNHTITWNAIFKNTPATVLTANLYTVGNFVYDGTNWVGV